MENNEIKPLNEWRKAYQALSNTEEDDNGVLYAIHNGKKFKVLKDITPLDLLDEEEYGYVRHYLIKFDCGRVIVALESEVEILR